MESTAVPNRRRRRTVSLLIVLAIVGAGWLGVQWWQADGSSWACGADDATSGCIAQVPLDVTDLPGFDGGSVWIAFDSLALGPDGGEVAVGLQSFVDRPTRSTEQAWVGVFDTSTGELLRVLFDTGQQDTPIHLETLAFSPDGSVLALESYVDGASSLQILDASTGDVQNLMVGPNGGSINCNRLGFSDDGRFLQCNQAIWSIAEGTVVEVLENENRYASTQGGGWAWARSGMTADAYSPNLDGIAVYAPAPLSTGVPTEQLYQIEWPTNVRPRDAYLGFDPTERFLVEERYSSPWTFWSSLTFWSDDFAPDGSRRDNADATLTVYDATDGSVRSEVELGRRNFAWSWSADGERFAAISRDLTLSVFALS